MLIKVIEHDQIKIVLSRNPVYSWSLNIYAEKNILKSYLDFTSCSVIKINMFST